jgi:pimeloyl-ACP methyl ester carboxylesterase
VLAQSHGRPGRITPEQARAAINAIRRCDAFDALLDATIPRHYAPRTALDVARITVAFGTRERILLRRAWRSTAQLPATVTVRRLPGCGHLPMADDPDLVADLIVSSAR